MPDPIPIPTPVKPPKTKRSYFVAKQVRAGDLDPDTKVWLDLPAEEAEDPDAALMAAAKRDDENENHKPGDTYLSTSRPTIKAPEKTVKTEWS